MESAPLSIFLNNQAAAADGVTGDKFTPYIYFT